MNDHVSLPLCYSQLVLVIRNIHGFLMVISCLLPLIQQKISKLLYLIIIIYNSRYEYGIEFVSSK